MAKISFYLRDKDADKPTPVQMFVSYGGVRLTKYPTGETIHPKYWDFKAKRVRQTKSYEGHSEFNTRLSNLSKKAEGLLRKYMNDHDQQLPTVEEFRALLDATLSRTPKAQKAKPIDLVTFLDSYLKEYETKINEKTGRPITSGSLVAYKQAIRVFKEFKAAVYKNKEFSFEQINPEFYAQFQRYLVQQNFATNTIGKHIKTLKTFLLEAQERGLITIPNLRKFKTLSEPVEAIYLNEDEINTLFELDLTKNTRLEKVRDLFLVGCWTGLRFSDFTRIRPENMDGEFIEIQTQKTGETIVVPIHEQVKAIMQRYEGKTFNSLPKPLTNQKMNEYLKELGKKAGFEDMVSETMTKGGVRKTVNYPKHELITTHTARRSFATNQYKAGFPAKSIMMITGHRTEASFYKYIKVTPREAANKLRELWSKPPAPADEKVKPLRKAE
jgi:integrase